MAVDYNIYIHAIGNGASTNQNPTVPWSQREGNGAFNQTQSQSSDDGLGRDAANIVSKIARAASNPDSVVATAASKFAKILPWVAAAYVVAQVSLKISEEVMDYQAIQSGDYSTQAAWQNWKQGVRNFFQPVSSHWSAHKVRLQWNNENLKRERHRDLLGDSVINSYTNRGV